MSLTIDSPVSDFINYVEENDLYNSFNKMLVQCDNTLKEILGVESFAFFGLERIIDQKKQSNLVKEKIMVSDDMTLEEIATKILASLHSMPMNLDEGKGEDDKEDDKEEEECSTPSTLEYEEESVESEYQNYDEFQAVDHNGKSVMFKGFERNGVNMIGLNDIVFEKEELLGYVNSLPNNQLVTEGVKEYYAIDTILIIGVSIFLLVTLFSLWLSLINYGLSKGSA